MRNASGRIPDSITGFNSHIETTSNYITQPSPLPAVNTNGARIGWIPADVTKWVDLRTRWRVQILLYADKKGTRTTLVKDTLLLIIKEAKDYNRENRLYDRIAANMDATLADFEVFNIKRGTALANSRATRAPEPGTKTVGIVLKDSGHLYHKLLVTTPDQSGRAKEAGVKEIMVFIGVGLATAVSPDTKDFNYAGDVSRGTITVAHDEATVGHKAWYYACVKNSRGEMGIASDPVGYIIT